MRRLVVLAIVVGALIAAPAEAAVAPVGRSQPPFRFSVSTLSAPVRHLMTGRSWHPGCPVPLRQLRLVHVRYWGFDRRAHRGSLVVRARYARSIVRVFRRLYAIRYPIRRMQLVDRFGGNDMALRRLLHLVPARVRPRAGRQPGREPVRVPLRLLAAERRTVPRSEPAPSRHDPQPRPGLVGVPRRRLGMGR
jgi:hypothetical protein